MIPGGDRLAVIENIKKCLDGENFNDKVETGDPVLTVEDERRITDTYIESRHSLSYAWRRAVALCATGIATKRINQNTEIVGLEKLPRELGGVIITSNHFSPLENTVIRHLVRKMGRRRLGIISQCTNFAMSGPIGFLMNYADTIPISREPHYLARDLMKLLKERLIEKKDAILLYPEQEMWFNYRKPRPPKNGAYFYAAKLGVPIISCFVEIKELDEDASEDFKKVRYVLHVLGVLKSDPALTVKENTEALAAADYNLKCSCYEKCYGKKLCYELEDGDIAGFKGKLI